MDEFEEVFEQDGYLWGFRRGDAIPLPIRKLPKDSLLHQFIVAGGAIAFTVVFSAAAIATSILIPQRELTLTQKYNFDTRQLEQAYIGHHRPFLLNGTVILWCKGKIETFESLGTVITTSTSFDNTDSFIDCR